MIETTSLGSTGAVISRLALGTAGFTEWITDRVAGSLLRHAVERGISLIDTAHAYSGSEDTIGRYISGELRDACIIATKLSLEGLEEVSNVRRVLDAQIRSSLRSLRTNRLDLLQLHEPAVEHIREEIMHVLERRLCDGSVSSIGLCNHTGAQLHEFLRIAPERVRKSLVSMQNHLSLLARSELEDAVPNAAKHGLTFMAWSPLGGGLLAHSRQPTPRSWMPWQGDAIERVLAEADKIFIGACNAGEHRIARALDFVWNAVPGSVAIVGPRTIEQLESIVQICQQRPSAAV